MVRPKGVEPLTFWSVVKCSIQLSYERIQLDRFHKRKLIISLFYAKCKSFLHKITFFPFISLIFLIFIYEKRFDIRIFYFRMVTRMRFELMTLWLKVKCSTDWASGSRMAALDGLEPSECQSQSLMPYHLATRQYRNGGRTWIWTMEPEGTDLQSAAFDHFAILPQLMVPTEGVEPPTYWLQVSCAASYAMSAKKMVGDIGLEPMTPCL